MKLHVVMPVLNCHKMTVDAYNSIKYDGFNFILIDQDSKDDTENWGRSMVSKNFQYIRNSPKVSLSAGWNQGIREALKDQECQYIAIVNNDVIFHPKTFDHLIKFMDESKYLMVTADNIASRMSIDTMLRMELPEPYTDYDLQKIEGWRAEGPDFSCFMISPKILKVVGWFDEFYEGAYCEDQDYHVRINRARVWAEKHNDQQVEANRIHAKRLSTAPYYHYASQTLKENIDLRPEISTMHSKNMNRYLRKWGADHPQAMDGHGNQTPWGDAQKNWRDW